MKKFLVRIDLIGDKIVALNDKGYPVPLGQTGPLTIADGWLCATAELIAEGSDKRCVRMPDGQNIWVSNKEMKSLETAA